MPEKTVFVQYKEMIEKTKQLHSELVELSSKVGGMVDSMDTNLSGSIAAANKISLPDSDVKVADNLGKYSEKVSMRMHESDSK